MKSIDHGSMIFLTKKKHSKQKVKEQERKANVIWMCMIEFTFDDESIQMIYFVFEPNRTEKKTKELVSIIIRIKVSNQF